MFPRDWVSGTHDKFAGLHVPANLVQLAFSSPHRPFLLMAWRPIDALRRIAPVTAIRGNVDIDDWAVAYPETEVVRLARKSIYVLHDLTKLQVDPIARGFDVVVSGHSHLPKIDTAGGVLYLNPGSAGRRRFGLPITLATIDVTPNGLRPFIHDLGDV
jgi:putative phosphoesterase